MEEKAGIKECKELLEMLRVLAVAGKKVSADGKVNSDDLLALVDLLKNVGVLVEGVKGLNQVPAELKDLHEDELKELGSIVLSILADVRAA